LSEEGLETAKSNDLDDLIECSSKTGENVETLFEILARIMFKKFI